MQKMRPLDYSKLVKQLRDRMGMTQEQFAQAIGVTYSTVNQWENGHRQPQPFLKKRLLELKQQHLSAGEGDRP